MAYDSIFQPARDQDAWGVFRGFRYQVDLSILRWSDVGPAEYLELERGEDIDRIAQALSTGADGEYVRTLEQVKVRSSSSLTLRNSSALEALANAHDHFASNTDLDLRFCYTTTAEVASERPNPFPDESPGIQLWEHVQKQALVGEDLSATLSHLRRFLATSAKPRRLSADVWQSFIAFTKDSTDDSFLDFVCRFEWSYAAPHADELTGAVHQRLRIRCGLLDDGQSSELYDRLFVFVFRLLSTKGLKRLSSTDLDHLAAHPTLTDTDHALLTRLVHRSRDIEHRVAEIESTVTELIERQFRQTGEAFAAIGKLCVVTTDTPVLVEHLSRRPHTVSRLVASAEGVDWLAIYGVVTTGKTHLCALVAEYFNTSCSWMHFSNTMSAPDATMLLYSALRSLAGDSTAELSRELFFDACRTLGRGTCLVLDDLPQLRSDHRFVDTLLTLGAACRQFDVKLLSSSLYRLPSRLTNTLGSDTLAELVVPPFTNSDARDVLSAHGAPTSLLNDPTVRFINGVTRGNPMLLTLAARFLREQDWQLDEAAFDALIRGDHATGISDEVIRRLCATQDDSQRELLYRLSLAIGSVHESVALALARVDPTIARPVECLTALTGAWLQRESAQKLIVSPLVQVIGSRNLSESTLHQCHITLAESIAQSDMNPWNAQNAISHFVAGGDCDRAGLLFVLLLHSMRRWKPDSALESALSIWCDAPLPEDMDLGIRLHIRAVQLWIFPKYGKQDNFVLSDLDRLMEEVTPHHVSSVMIVAAIAALFLTERDYERAIRYLSQAIAVLRNADVEDADLLLPSGKRPLDLLWTVVIRIQVPADVTTWLNAFANLSPDEQQLVMSSPDAPLGCSVLADRLLYVESTKQAEDRDWRPVLATLHRLYDRANDSAWQHLTACTLKSELTVHGEYLKTIETCRSKVLSFTDDASRTPETKALIAGTYGKMLVAASNYAEAIVWLERAIPTPTVGLEIEHMMTLLALAKCSDRTDADTALQYATSAASIARTVDSLPDIEAAKSFGELAIAIVSRNPSREGAIEAYAPWAEAAHRMLIQAERDDAWKDLFVVFCHIQGYLVPFAANGTPPDRARDGSPFAPPRQGMFFTSHAQRIEEYRDVSIAVSMWFMSQYAQVADDELAAGEWAQRASDAIDQMPRTYASAFIKYDMIPDFVGSNQFADAFDAAIRGCAALVVTKEVSDKQSTPIPPDTPLEDLMSELSADAGPTIDRFVVVSSIIPTLLRICTVALYDRKSAMEHAASMAAIYRQSADTAKDSRFYTGSAEIFELVATESNTVPLLKLAHSFDEHDYRELRVLGYLASALTGDPTCVFHAQIAVMATVFTWYPPSSPTHRKLLLPFIEGYWTTALRDQKFHFHSPPLVNAALGEAREFDHHCRVRQILRAVRPGIRVQGLSEALEWLNSDPQHLR